MKRYIENDRFLPCSDDTDVETLALVRALRPRRCSFYQNVVHLIARLSMVHSALRAGSMSVCNQCL